MSVRLVAAVYADVTSGITVVEDDVFQAETSIRQGASPKLDSF